MNRRLASTAVGALFCVVPQLAFAGTNDTVEMTIRAQFAAHPEMIAIAECESRFRQFDGDGDALNGGSGGMIGIFQVNAGVHRSFAKRLGYDIDTIEGNILYANYLYQNEGTTPWLDSFPCWGKKSANAENATSSVTATLSRDLSLGVIHDDVLLLQRLLNAAGFTISREGPGSVGNETNKFGTFTKMALQKFQCAQLQVCSGSEYTSGYGFAGARTRAALLSYTPNASVIHTQDSIPKASQEVSVPTVVAVSTEDAAKIVALQAQIAELTKILLTLVQKRNAGFL